MDQNPLWLVTGVSSGLGRAIALGALEAGFRVAGTVRKDADVAAFEALAPGRAIAVLLDVSEHDTIAGVIDRIEREVGPIGVLVNNAGYGHEGAVENVSIAEFKALFDANLFGMIAVSQAVIPHMRARGAGRIINISSITAISASGGIGAYNSSKAAMNCISEVLSKELAPFGIRVSYILPGSFRTDWAGRSLKRNERVPYPHLQESSDARRKRDGAQAGDPKKFAAITLELAAMDDPPVTLVISPNAVQAYRNRAALMVEQADRFPALSADTDFD